MTAGSEAKTLLASSVKHDVAAVGNELLGATADDAAPALVDPVYAAATKGLKTQSFPETEAAGLIDKTSGFLQGAVDTAFKGLGTGIGLPSGEATIVAGVCTNFILAPITGPLGEASTFIEIAGIVIGLATGAHPLVLACVKPLLHSQLEHLVSEGLVDMLHGPHADNSRSAAQSMLMYTKTAPDQGRLTRSLDVIQQATRQRQQQCAADAARRSMSNDPSRAPSESKRHDGLWLCLGFVPKPQIGFSITDYGVVEINQSRPGTSPPLVLPVAEDEFTRALSGVLRRSTVSRVDVPGIKAISGLSEGQHFVVSMQGVGGQTANGNGGPQAKYLHPGCVTGQCVPAGRRRCFCWCMVCTASTP